MAIAYHGIAIPHEAIADFCRRYHIRRLALFGSILTTRFRPDSDIDMLVEFEPGRAVGYLRLAGFQLELAGLLGHNVDLRTPAELSRYFRDEVVRSSQVVYAAA